MFDWMMVSLKVSWVVTPTKAGVHPAKGGMEITGFRRMPRTRSGVHRNDGF
jgi:hypothetical protein